MNTTRKKSLTQQQPGLAIMIQGQKKKYSFTHGEVDTKRSYSLGGLYAEVSSQSETSQEKTTFSSVRESVWGEEPSVSQRDNLGFALRTLPQFFERAGFTVLDDQLQEFHHQAKIVKERLIKGASGGIVSPADMKKAEDYMEQYNLDGWTMKVVAIRVSEEPFHGSRKRADGLHEKRQTLRTVYLMNKIDQEVTDQIADYLLAAVAGEAVKLESSTAQYKAVRKNNSVQFIPDLVQQGVVEEEEVRVQRELPAGASLIGGSSIFRSKR